MSRPKLIEEPSYRDRVYVFEERITAGHLLAKKLKGIVGEDAIVLAIPAGGVPVGYMIAKELDLPFDVIVVRKIHIPWNPEAGFGAITWDGIVIFNYPLLKSLGLSEEEVDRCVAKEKEEIERRLRIFGGSRPFLDLKDKTVLLVDDGLASGFTMLASIKSVKRRVPREIIVAVPTASLDAIELIEPHVDLIVCLNVRSGPIFAVADAYKVWYDLSDEDVVDILEMAGLKPK